MKQFRLAFFVLLCPLAANAQQLLTLEEAIQQGITKQYAIQISRQREQIAANENTLRKIIPFLDLISHFLED
jgi:hypothetical protein